MNFFALNSKRSLLALRVDWIIFRSQNNCSFLDVWLSTFFRSLDSTSPFPPRFLRFSDGSVPFLRFYFFAVKFQLVLIFFSSFCPLILVRLPQYRLFSACPFYGRDLDFAQTLLSVVCSSSFLSAGRSPRKGSKGGWTFLFLCTPRTCKYYLPCRWGLPPLPFFSLSPHPGAQSPFPTGIFLLVTRVDGFSVFLPRILFHQRSRFANF